MNTVIILREFLRARREEVAMNHQGDAINREAAQAAARAREVAEMARLNTENAEAARAAQQTEQR